MTKTFFLAAAALAFVLATAVLPAPANAATLFPPAAGGVQGGQA